MGRKSIHDYELEANNLLDKCEQGLEKSFIEANRERIFDKYVDRYFRTWEDFSMCMSGDKCVFAPIIMCLRAEMLGVEPTYPVRIIRALHEKL